MAKQKYDLLPGEYVILKTTGVNNGFWSNYNDELVLTNQCIIWVKLGTFGNFKGIVRFPLSKVTQAIIGKSSSGGKQLEVYHSSGKEDFSFISRNDRELRVWSMAIADRFKEDSDIYDYNYYQNFLDDNLQVGLYADPEQESSTGIINGQFVGDVAKSVLKSGNLSIGGVIKGVKKASVKQVQGNMTQGLKDELGITEIQDEFTEIGNEFREAFGLKPKVTQKEKKEKKLNTAFNQKVAHARQEEQVKLNTETVNENVNQNTNPTTMSLDEQIETMKKLKELLDVGILSQEEFDLKKKEVMGL